MQGPGLGDQRWLENPQTNGGLELGKSSNKWRFQYFSMEKCGKKHLLMEV
jgi:hypothetical protein